MFDLNDRAGGVLLHPTSLPGPHGNGDLGPHARRFAEQLAGAGQRWWQMLPVNPPGAGNSPYSARSAFAGSPLFIDLDDLVERGLLRKRPSPPRLTRDRVDYPAAGAFRGRELRRAFAAFQQQRGRARFAFGDDLQAHEFRPHNYPRRSVAFTGTHDNDTIVGWFFDPGGPGSQRTPEQTERERRLALAYLGASDAREIHWKMIRCLFSSVANLAAVPVQDVLGLGSEARMNLPGTSEGNWEWRMRAGALTERVLERLAGLSWLYDRIPPRPGAELRTFEEARA